MKIFKWLLLVLGLAVVGVGIAAWTLPADVAWRYLSPQLGPVTLVGIRGTVWEGHADGVSVFGRDLGEVDWRIDKLPMLMRNVRADVRIRGADIDTSGVIERDASGRLTAHDIRFRVPASLFAPALDIPSLKLLGNVSGTFNQISLVDGLVSDASGEARWGDAGVSGSAEARFGDILAEFATKPDGRIGGTLADDGNGDLEVNGNFSIGATDFSAEAFLAARNGNPRITEALRYIGQAQPDGSSHLLITGTLFKVF